MSPCTHGVVEIETAANCDGLCPLCLQAALAAARAEVDALREPAPSVVCQKCGRLGGKVVSFEHDGISESRWVCPLCLDDIEAERDEAVRRATVAVEDSETLEDALRRVLSSAKPHPIEHPTMTAAWQHAGDVLRARAALDGGRDDR